MLLFNFNLRSQFFLNTPTSFIRSHFSHSLSIRPNNPFTLLITFPNRFDLERLIYSATIQPQTLTKSELQFCLSVPGFGSRPVSQSLHGFICFDVGSSGLRVCNPSTRQFVSLPTTELETHYDPLFNCYSTNSFGFDPVSYQHKAIRTWIICKEDPVNEMIIPERRVCTLGNSEQKQWRRINGGQPHFPFTESILLAYLSATRHEGVEIDRQLVAKDAKALFKAGEKKLGTNEETFIHIFSERSRAHLIAVNSAYHDMYGNSLKKAVKSETSGKFELALLTILSCAENPAKQFAKALHKAMKGLGTDDNTLIRIIVTRTEIDMQYIKAEYQKKYKKTLNNEVHSETSSHYRTFLLSLLGPDNH